MPAVNKPSKSPASGPPEVPVSHLEEKITLLIRETGAFLRKIWLPGTVVLAALLVVLLFYLMVTWIHASKEEALGERLYTLVLSPEARKAKFSDQEAEIDKLVRDSRGADSERYILKETVDYLQKKAFPQNADPYGSLDLPDVPEIEAGGAGGQDPAAIMKKIEEYARAGQERFSGDEDMKAWSSNILRWTEAEKEFKTKPIEKRSFAPVIPPAGPGAPSGAPPASAAPQAPAPTAAPAQAPPEPPAPAGGQSTSEPPPASAGK